MTEHEKRTENALNNIRSKIVAHCSTVRQGFLTKIADKLEREKVTPASTSTGRHGAHPGGLVCHVSEVLNVALTLGEASSRAMLAEAEKMSDDDYLGRAGKLLCLQPESIVTAALLHDLNKLEDLNGNKLYVPNMIKNGTEQSEKKPFARSDEYGIVKALAIGAQDSHVKTFFSNPDLFSFPEGLVSLAVAEKCAPGIVPTLSEEEKQAVIFHSGLYEKCPHVGYTGKESALAIIIHSADMLASRVGS